MAVNPERLNAELAELKERLIKLNAFRLTPEHDRLPVPDRALLAEQFEAMANYSNALEKRIARLN